MPRPAVHPPSRGREDLCAPLTERRDALREERDNLERALARATPNLLGRVLALLDAKQAELDAAEAALAAATSAPAPIDAATLTPEALRARVADRVRRLRAAFAEDVPSARETLRLLLDGPARSVPLMVNGKSRYLVRGRLSAGNVHSSLTTPKYGGDGRGMARRTIRREVTVRSRWAARAVARAEEVDQTERAEVWGRWLAEGRYRSRRELARACGVSASVVTRVLGGK